MDCKLASTVGKEDRDRAHKTSTGNLGTELVINE